MTNHTMRYLLLSVLVVSLVGVLVIPSVFGEAEIKLDSVEVTDVNSIDNHAKLKIIFLVTNHGEQKFRIAEISYELFANGKSIGKHQGGPLDSYLKIFLTKSNSDEYLAIVNGEHVEFSVKAQYTIETAWQLIDKEFEGKIGETINITDVPEVEQQTQQQSKGGGCLIATAAFGSEMAPQVQFLRELRDNTVLQTESGTSFMTGFNQFYYSFSPAVADYERENPAFKEAVKITLTPLLASLTLLQYADIDSESEMLGYGIGVILLNIGMYFVAPAVLIMAVRKRI